MTGAAAPRYGRRLPGTFLLRAAHLTPTGSHARASALASALEGPRLRALAATSAHAALVQDCLEAAPQYYCETEGSPPGPGAAADLIAEAETDGKRRVFAFLPRSGGPVVGVLDLILDYPEPRVAHVALLLFREAFQGQGLGREATAALEAALAARGFTALRLSVVDENAGAREFWERVGFAEVGRLDRGVTVFEKKLQGGRAPAQATP